MGSHANPQSNRRGNGGFTNEHFVYLASVWIKGFAGIAEIIVGSLVLLVDPSFVDTFVVVVTAPELIEDPEDLVANYVRRAAHAFTVDTKIFASAYLVIHGLIKVVLVIGLLRERLWAYPISIWFLVAFIGYQSYRFAHTGSIWLVLLTVVDVVVAFLIWREYRRRRAGRC